MKIRLFSIFTLAGLLLGSCTVDEIPTEGGSIIAEMETDQTRTAVTDAGSFTWSAGDQVWLHTTSGSVVGTLSDGAGSSDAKFSYDAFIGEMTGMAVYPYNDGHSIDGKVLNFVLPASYDLGSSLTNTNAAMYGVNVGGSIKFNHLAGVMRFKFKNVPAGVNKFTITLDKKIKGTFTVDLTANYPVIETSSTSTAPEKTITLNFNALTAKSDISVYVPLPIGTYNSLELGLYDDDQSVWTYSKSVTNTVNRKSLKLMPVVTLSGSVDGDLEGGDSDGPIGYVDEYGENHGPGVKIGETVWAPVNCGYHKTDFKYGKLYQWGRKYGQGYDTDKVAPTIQKGRVSLEVGQAEENSNCFYTNDSLPFDWLLSSRSDLWNGGTDEVPVKTEYDPCPKGWRVPTYTEFQTITHLDHPTWTTDDSGLEGYLFTGKSACSEEVRQVFFIATGYRFGEKGTNSQPATHGTYWTSTPYPITYNCSTYYFYFNSMWAEVDMGSYSRSNGLTVRCVQE